MSCHSMYSCTGNVYQPCHICLLWYIQHFLVKLLFLLLNLITRMDCAFFSVHYANCMKPFKCITLFMGVKWLSHFPHEFHNLQLLKYWYCGINSLWSYVSFQSASFQKTARRIQKKYWWKNTKMTLILIAVVLVIIIIIVVAVLASTGVFSSGKGSTTTAAPAVVTSPSTRWCVTVPFHLK